MKAAASKNKPMPAKPSKPAGTKTSKASKATLSNGSQPSIASAASTADRTRNRSSTVTTGSEAQGESCGAWCVRSLISFSGLAIFVGSLYFALRGFTDQPTVVGKFRHRPSE